MNEHATAEDDDRDWRLVAELGRESGRGPLHGLVERVRDPQVVRDARAAVGDDVVVTHDGERLFAYAPSRGAIERAQAAIEAALAHDGLQAEIKLSRYSGASDEWVDPDAPAPAGVPAPGAAGAPATRTIVVTVGKMIREEFEQSMRSAADQLGLRCEILEHPHLLSSQVAFTVTGPQRKVDEFAAAIGAEERATIRTELTVMASPL